MSATAAERWRGSRCALLASLLALAGMASVQAQEAKQARKDPYAAPRRALVAELRAQAGDGVAPIGNDVLRVIGQVPRHEFVPAAQRRHAYDNRPLAIGYGQTISQPYIVALMTALAKVDKDDVVLEVGTGSGYQAAVLSPLVAEVYSVEIIAPLGEQAGRRLRTLGYDNVHTRIADGYYGWKEHAPFDAIVVTAAAQSVPPPLVAQLKPGGRMVIPVGGSFFTQVLMLVEKDAQGRVRTRQVLPVRFVPLTRSSGG